MVLRLPAVKARSPAVTVMPPLVTVKPVPTVAEFVTVRPVLAPFKVTSPLNCLEPAKVWPLVVSIRPGLVVLALCRNKILPVMEAPLTLAVPPFRLPMVLTPVPPVLRASQADPFQMKPALVLAAMVTPYIVKLALPLREFT